VLEVLALSGFAVGPHNGRLSPYAQVYYACKGNGEASLKALLSTRLMIASTQFKWQAFAWKRLIETAGIYLAHFLLAAGTFVFSTRIIVRRGPIETVMPDALHVALLVSNTKCLYDEAQQMRLAWRYEGAIDYLSFGSVDMMWNLMDLGGIAAVASLFQHVNAFAPMFLIDFYVGHQRRRFPMGPIAAFDNTQQRTVCFLFLVQIHKRHAEVEQRIHVRRQRLSLGRCGDHQIFGFGGLAGHVIGDFGHQQQRTQTQRCLYKLGVLVQRQPKHGDCFVGALHFHQAGGMVEIIVGTGCQKIHVQMQRQGTLVLFVFHEAHAQCR
jgi:hypothetical protein